MQGGWTGHLVRDRMPDRSLFAVPEPSSIVLVGLGIAGGAILFRGRRVA